MKSSLEKIETSVVLIIGGDNNENDYDYALLAQQVKQKVIGIVYIGNNSDKILKNYSTAYLLFTKAQTIREAVQLASCYAKSGDVVLFSPACENENYKNRGKEFNEIVKHLSS